MEQESHLRPKLTEYPSEPQIITLIQATYQSKSTEQITHSESILVQLLQIDKFIQRLFGFLQSSQPIPQVANQQQFKISVALLIKKFSYQFSKKQNASKDGFVQKLFCLLCSQLASKIKEPLGTSLEYILNHDQEIIYQPKVIEKVTEMLQSQPDRFVFEGLLIIAMACLNSLIEAEDQFNFVWKILDSLIRNTLSILQILKTQPPQHLVFEDSKRLIKLSKRVFDLMELAFSRLIQQEELIEDKLDDIRHHPSLQFLFYAYLSNFSYSKSILSSIPEINSVKQLIVQIIFGLYMTRPMPQNIFNLFFITMLLQAERQTYEEEEEHIVTRVLQTMEGYLEKGFYLQTFGEHKLQTLLSLMMYSVTKPDQFDMIEEQPQRFVELSEEFTEGFKNSCHVKVRAASLFRVYASKFDEVLRNTLEVIVIIITFNVEQNKTESPCTELYNALKSQAQSLPFFNIDPALQMQTCFNILSLLSPFIIKRQDLNKVVYALMITHFQSLQQVQRPILVLRLIRMIGYYPTTIYYHYIKSKMGLGKVFILEGLKSFERILKANRYPEIFDVLSEIFAELIAVMGIGDSIFSTIIMNHYERILKKNMGLYSSVLIKLRDTFIENIEKGHHVSFLCLNFIYSMLNKQNQSSFRHKIIEHFHSIQEYYNKVTDFYRQKILTSVNDPSVEQNKKILKAIQNYEDKIVDIYSIIIKKEVNVSSRAIQFSINQLGKISGYNRNAQIFKLYNVLFLKIDKDFDRINVFYDGFMGEIRKMFKGFLEDHQNFTREELKSRNLGKLDILPNLSYLVSQIFSCFYQIHLQQQDLKWMLQILNSVTEQVKQYVLLIILTYMYCQPQKIKQSLKQMNLYEDTLKYLLTTTYSEKLIRKIFLLAMSKLLQIEEAYFQDIMRECIKYFNEQFKQNQIKKTRKQHIDPKMRRMLQDDHNRQQEEQEMIEEKSHQKEAICSFPEFKHPFSALSQYDQFKVRIWQNPDIIEKLNEKDRNELREILQMDWFGKGVRKIVHIKKEFEGF